MLVPSVIFTADATSIVPRSAENPTNEIIMGTNENARSLRYGRAVSSAGEPAEEDKVS